MIPLLAALLVLSIYFAWVAWRETRAIKNHGKDCDCPSCDPPGSFWHRHRF